jgi:hypothetical protein
MSIRFYTTDVSASKTASEIQQKLAESTARRVAMHYDGEGRPAAIEFVLMISGEPLPFRIEPDVDGMEKALDKDPDTPGDFDHDQARRVAWRIWKEWINAILAFRDTHQASLDQLLLGFGVTPDGRTVHERLTEDRNLLRLPTSSQNNPSQ